MMRDKKFFSSHVMGWDGMRDRFFRASRVMTGCGMRCDRDGMGRVMEKRPITRPIYNPDSYSDGVIFLLEQLMNKKQYDVDQTNPVLVS